MNLSNESLKTLASFTKMSGTIRINPGHVVAVSTEGNTLVAQAELKEEFPVECGFADFPEFISIVQSLNNPNLKFGQKSVVISSGKYSIDYIYANDQMTRKTPKFVGNNVSYPVTFDLSEADMSQIRKLAGVMTLDQLSFVGDGEKVTLRAAPKDKVLHNTVTFDCSYACDKRFEIVTEFHLLMGYMMPGSYKVGIMSTNIVYFQHSKLKLQYWMGVLQGTNLGDLRN